MPDIAAIRRMLSLTMTERLATLNCGAGARLGDALTTLARHRVELVVVGGVACILQGAPITTADLDVVPQTGAKNIERLWSALVALDAGYRDDLGHIVRPDRTALAGPGDHIPTACGTIDVIGHVSDELAYDELVALATRLVLGGHAIHVLGLPTLIELRERANRDKDRAVLDILRRTRDEICA